MLLITAHPAGLIWEMWVIIPFAYRAALRLSVTDFLRSWSGDVRSIRDMASKLRRELGEDGDNPTYMFTEPRIGYRMLKEEIAGGNRPQLPNSRWDGERGLTTGLGGAST